MGLYGSRAYIARHGEPTSVLSLKHHYLVGFDEGMSQRNKAVQRLERCFMPEKIVHRSSSFVGQLHATQEGIGLGVHDCFMADVDPNLVRIMPEQFDHRMEMWLVTHADMRRSARIRAVYDFLVAALTAEQPQLTGKSTKVAKGPKTKAA
jgi:DNA-binding transcriptional LysR family regulator